MNNSLLASILRSGIIIGVLDAIAASVFSFVRNGASPAAVFRYVASGVFGKEAFTGGLGIASAGLLFHFTVATGWTAFFYFLYPRLAFMGKNLIVSGIGYGIFVWLMMNYVVVPLSQVPAGLPKFSIGTVVMIMIHMFVIGLPIAYLTGAYYSRN